MIAILARIPLYLATINRIDEYNMHLHNSLLGMDVLCFSLILLFYVYNMCYTLCFICVCNVHLLLAIYFQILVHKYA